MSGKYILDAAGHPVAEPDVLKWAAWFETANAVRVVQQTHLDEVEVSTVFLGIDHNFLGKGAPLLYETIVFGGKLDGEQYRYETRLQAERGHVEMCEKVRAAERINRRIDL